MTPQSACFLNHDSSKHMYSKEWLLKDMYSKRRLLKARVFCQNENAGASVFISSQALCVFNSRDCTISLSLKPSYKSDVVELLMLLVIVLPVSSKSALKFGFTSRRHCVASALAFVMPVDFSVPTNRMYAFFLSMDVGGNFNLASSNMSFLAY